MTTETFRCQCGDMIENFSFHFHSKCDYVYKLPESNVEFHCLKFPNHKGKHAITVLEIDLA